jgi:hypothetical protein
MCVNNQTEKAQRREITMAISIGGHQQKLLGSAFLEAEREQEHIWRELLQKQLGEHWLNLYCPEKPKKDQFCRRSVEMEAKQLEMFLLLKLSTVDGSL